MQRFSCLGAYALFAGLFYLLSQFPIVAATSFAQKIAPILVDKCLSCHNPAKAKGDYQVQTAEAFLKPGGSAEPTVVPGHPEQSKIYRLVTAPDPDDRMPQKSEPLSPIEIAVLRIWIEEGAPLDVPPKASLESLVPRVYPRPPVHYARPVPILALAFSPDGQSLVASGYHEILFLQPTNGTVLARLPELPQRISNLAFSPDGQLLAAACGTPGQVGEFVLVSVKDSRIIQRFPRLGDQALATAFSPDGKTLATGGADSFVRTYDVASGQLHFAVEPHTDWIMALAFTPDGTKLISGSRDKTVRVLDAKTGEVQVSYLDHQGPVFAVAVAADNRHVFSAGRDKNIHQWDLGSAKKIREIPGASGDVFQLRLQGSTLIASSADQSVRIYSVDDKPALRETLTGHKDYVFSLAFDAERARLASGSFDGEVRIWDSSSGKELAHFLAAPGLP